jgi:ABC-type uncharacterized transport system substrate-binding protein
VLIRSDDPARAFHMEGFQRGLREHGWIEGQNFELDFRSAESQADRLPALVAELVRRESDDLPVERPTAFAFIFNLKTARTLGLTTPESVLPQANETIQ